MQITECIMHINNHSALQNFLKEIKKSQTTQKLTRNRITLIPGESIKTPGV